MKRAEPSAARSTEPAPERAENSVVALARGLALLRAVGEADRPVGNRELSEHTGIPKATVSRLAATLVAGGYLKQLADGDRFTLGATLLHLSSVYLRGFDLRSHARSHLSRLADFAGAAVHLGIREGLDILLIDSVRARSALILSRLEVGSRMSIATSAAGRAYLAALPAEERAALRADIRSQGGKGGAAVDRRLDEAIDEYERLGFCTSFGEWHPQIHALGFVLHGPRGELHAVSCGGPAYLLTKDTLLRKVAPFMLETRDAIAREVGSVAPA